jgi:hypothetical protein
MSARKQIAIVWEHGPVQGSIEVAYGKLGRLNLTAGQGKVSGAAFVVRSSGPCRLVVEVADATTAPGACATRVTVNTKKNAITFFLRDASRAFPIFIPSYGVAVTPASDRRTYSEIAHAISQRQAAAAEGAKNASEESYEAACRENRDLVCPTWLGLGRDMRFFEVHYQQSFGCWGYVKPRYHSTVQRVPETEDTPYMLQFMVGPGSSCRTRITRRLEDGVLPILHSTQEEDDIFYELTLFATLETRPLSATNVRGSDCMATYANTGGNMLKPEEREAMRPLLEQEMRQREEETVCWVRVEAQNRGAVPRYAWFRGAALRSEADRRLGPAAAADYDGASGFSRFAKGGRVFGVHRLNGRPAPQLELAVLLAPGETATYDVLVPHQPLPPARAQRLAQQDFETHHEACRGFWDRRLKQAARIEIPEAAVDRRMKAGLLHCDLVAHGREPDGPVAATIGWYAPIGSESAPIIQFFDAMGWHSLAARCIDFFLERQRPDGFIQNFGGYQLETGPALWTMGEHFRLTRDQAWLRRIQPKMLKACEYLLAWRARNKRPELRGKGYGLLDGKVADPEDFFHSFMLNGLSYLGLARAAEVLAGVAPAESRRLAAEAKAFRQDIRKAFYEAVARSPVIPLSDGAWVPTVPPWTEYPGALALYAEGGNWVTHGAFGARDSLIGALYLVISEVLDAHETGAEFLLRSHQQLFTVKNAGLSQPYYCRHDHMHLLRGEVNEFLKTYYNQFTALQDRETYTFWEHYFGASQHKTHEEGWFLMQTRWMLALERHDELQLLRGIPRAWLADGKKLSFHGLKTYFGAVSLDAEVRLDEGVIEARYALDPRRKPRTLLLRLPHPQGRRATRVDPGVYDAESETVRIERPRARGTVRLRFA